MLRQGRPTSDQPESDISWLLRELRPVSFHLKRGPEAKHLKFGFIAQELETVFPNLVRGSETDNTMTVSNQDLIAVLTLAVQSLQNELVEQRKIMEEQRRLLESMVQEQMARMDRIERLVFTQQV